VPWRGRQGEMNRSQSTADRFHRSLSRVEQGTLATARVAMLVQGQGSHAHGSRGHGTAGGGSPTVSASFRVSARRASIGSSIRVPWPRRVAMLVRSSRWLCPA
jgi:hypothetical protein